MNRFDLFRTSLDWLLAVAICAFLTAAYGLVAPAECTTDTECARLCPADDQACDGGPQ